MEIKKILGKTLLLIGIFMLFYNVFSFSSSCGGDPFYQDEAEIECENRPIRYFYTESSRLGISLGAVFFSLGLLLIKNK